MSYETPGNTPMDGRPATPPIIGEPIDIAHGEHNLDWYYGEHAGGYVLSFGKYEGQKIHKTSMNYMDWCKKELKDGPTIHAIEAFHAGLQIYAETNCGDLRFPFGKYKGRKISECPESYLSWANNQPDLASKYGIFFEALTRWLERPLEERGGHSEPSHRKEVGRNTVSARGLDDRSKGRVDSPSKSNSQSRVVQVDLRVISEGKKSSDVDPREDSGGVRPTSNSKPKSKADSVPLEHRVVSATVKLQGEHDAPGFPTMDLNLQVTEPNLRESEAQAREQQGIDTNNPFGKLFKKLSMK